MAQVLNLKTPLTTEQVESGEDATIDIQLPSSRKSWDLLESLNGDEGIVLTAADGGVFLGDLSDWDEGRYTITIELR